MTMVMRTAYDNRDDAPTMVTMVTSENTSGWAAHAWSKLFMVRMVTTMMIEDSCSCAANDEDDVGDED